MTIDVMTEDDRWTGLELERLATRASDAALAHLGLDPEAWDIALLACGDTRIAALNADFRGKPTPTNVLSWPSEERAAEEDGGTPDLPEPDGDTELGDIAIAWETCVREAEDAGKPLTDHVTHLIVHAVLHLLGYDHESDLDATLMERKEVEILGKLGLPDPYET
ncbi:endoribonuclease YbeY [Primorskyibacter flagellatus]|uniref:Endoribonuclease YbeY n=1 Tax=Primorskyibacter flagellatus TaxID=1387277 RepID=A0A917A8M2_9RHOB|nr:rRNA maturation RNase YbeY [Primorskyibacter flagellatus]GGE35705.1 endoribonuclease YbeY [Primorskyibacter flagellatus]